MIFSYHGKEIPAQEIEYIIPDNPVGASILDLSNACEAFGFSTYVAELDLDQLRRAFTSPCIAHLTGDHYVVVYDITRTDITIGDPAKGLMILTHEAFLERWRRGDTASTGVAIFIDREGKGRSIVRRYLARSKKFLASIVISVIIGSGVQFAFPVVTQTLVDNGIGGRDPGFVYLALLGQVFLSFGRICADFWRRRIMVTISKNVTVTIIAEFLAKLMNTSQSFFDSRSVGDILQRIEDHNRIERFVTASLLGVTVSLISVVIFSSMLASYDPYLLLIFAVSAVTYLVYFSYFNKRRKEIDYETFRSVSDTQNIVVQIVQGITDIKLANAQQSKIDDWKLAQEKLQVANRRNTKLLETQEAGLTFITEIRNAAIICLAAMAVIDGSMTLGMMLATQYIVGQLHGPVNDCVAFIKDFQRMNIGLERIKEIEDAKKEKTTTGDPFTSDRPRRIQFHDVSFSYEQPRRTVLDHINADFPPGAFTAIVGESGGGKSTLLKLTLKLYEPQAGQILVANTPLLNIDVVEWRKKCGLAIQGGYLFTDTIQKNITLSDGKPDQYRYEQAISISNLEPVIDQLKLKDKTIIGSHGLQLSEGQRQRVILARAIYKDPQYLFLDEPTSSIDSLTESIIMSRLREFSRGRTVVIVAHRLSTIVDADKIIVFDRGSISEQGTHEELLALGGSYLKLFHKQNRPAIVHDGPL